MAPLSREQMERLFVATVPKFGGMKGIPRHDPHFQGVFQHVYECKQFLETLKAPRLCEIVSEQDASAKRSEVYAQFFPEQVQIERLNFWTDQLTFRGKTYAAGDELPALPEDELFDVVLSTKVILEHTKRPEEVVQQFQRLLRPGGHLFFIVPHVRVEHQIPYDFYRFTRYAIQALMHRHGFKIVSLKPAAGSMVTLVHYMNFFWQGFPFPLVIHRLLRFVQRRVFMPLSYALDPYDTSSDLSMYYIIRAEKL